MTLKHNSLASLFSDIADAIRGKTGASAQIKADDFPDEIDAIPAGGGAVSVTDEPDAHGGTVRHINGVSLAGDTVAAAVLFRGYSAHDAQGQPVTGAYDPPSGTKQITANGAGIDVAGYASVDVNVAGGGKNAQYVMGSASVHSNGYTSTGMSLTVAKTGTYSISWAGWRSSSQGTMGTNLYKNGTAGTNQQTFTNTYGQQITLTGQSLTAGDVLTLYATAGSTSRYMWVANLIIEEV